MFDLGFAELLVIGIVALIIVGPKDLPVLFRNVGRWVGRMRGMAREFSSAMNQAADESGIRDVQKTIRTATNPIGAAMDGVKEAASDLTNFDPESETGKLAAQKADRSLAAKKIEAASARAAAERKAREAKEAMQKAEEYEAALKAETPKE